MTNSSATRDPNRPQRCGIRGPIVGIQHYQVPTTPLIGRHIIDTLAVRHKPSPGPCCTCRDRGESGFPNIHRPRVPVKLSQVSSWILCEPAPTSPTRRHHRTHGEHRPSPPNRVRGRRRALRPRAPVRLPSSSDPRCGSRVGSTDAFDAPDAPVFFKITNVEYDVLADGPPDEFYGSMLGEWGCWVDPSVTRILQTGLEQSRVPRPRGAPSLPRALRCAPDAWILQVRRRRRRALRRGSCRAWWRRRSRRVRRGTSCSSRLCCRGCVGWGRCLPSTRWRTSSAFTSWRSVITFVVEAWRLISIIFT